LHCSVSQPSLAHKPDIRLKAMVCDMGLLHAQMACDSYIFWSTAMKKILAMTFTALLASGAGSTNANGVPSMGSDVTANTSSTAAESRNFLISAYQDGVAEIALSRLALEKAVDDNVKKFAQRMIDDHTQANNEITQLAQAKNIPLPTVPSAADQATLQNMSNLNGTDFDQAYMRHNVMVHEKDVSLFREQAISGTDPDIKTFAANTLPVLEIHLLSAKTIDGMIDPAVFLMNAFQDGKAEIQLSTLALQKSSNSEVKQFAQKMIDDHTQLNKEITQLAHTENITLPVDIPVEHKAAYDDMSKMSGVDFDKAYMNYNVLVHALSVTQAAAQARSGTDIDIRAFAIKTLPKLSMHLKAAKDIYERIEPSLLFEAFQDGMGEILLSKLALQKTSDAEVRQYAQRMINDHTRANTQVEQLAQKKNIALPHEVPAEQVRAYIRLSQLSGQAFDKAYMGNNVNVHEKDVASFKVHAQNENDADIRAFAVETLPVLTTHLEQAQKINSRLNT